MSQWWSQNNAVLLHVLHMLELKIAFSKKRAHALHPCTSRSQQKCTRNGARHVRHH